MKKLTFLFAFLLFTANIFGQVVPGVIYGTGGSQHSHIFTVNPVDLSGVSISVSGDYGPVTEITFDPTNSFLYGATGGANNNLITIDLGTGVETLIGSFNPPGKVLGLAFVGNILYGAFFDNSTLTSTLVTIDPSTAALSIIGTIFTPPDPLSTVTGLAYDIKDSTMYGLGSSLGEYDERLITIDLTTATPVMIGQVLLSEDACRGLTVGPDGILYTGTHIYGGLPGHLISIDRVTGTGTVLGPTVSASFSGLAYPSIPISNWAIIIGLLLIGIFIVIRFKRIA